MVIMNYGYNNYYVIVYIMIYEYNVQIDRMCVMEYMNMVMVITGMDPKEI